MFNYSKQSVSNTKLGVSSQLNTLVQLENISLSYGRLKALDSIYLEIKQGEILFLTGVSGAGKSSLLNLIAGDLEQSQGKRFVSPLLSNSEIAQVFQDNRYIPNLSVRDNLLFAFDKKIYSSRQLFEQDMLDMGRVLGINQFLDQRIDLLNGGMKQKIAILRALLKKPKLLLADEPTSSLDRLSSHKVYELLNFYNTKKKLTVIWATHNKDLIKDFPGKILHLDQGKLVYTGHACFI